MLKYLALFVSVCLHLFCIGVVIYFAWPIFSLYWNQKPAVGIDLFLSVDFVTYIHNHLNWPWASWKYIWYGGTPLAQTYPLLHFYLIQPLLLKFSAVEAVQIYVVFSMVLFFIFSYFFYYSLSRSRGLALVLSVATAYSYNLWSQLYWAGSIPYTATLFMLPLSLYLVVLSKEKNDNRYFYFAGLLSGVMILGHPQSFIAFTVPLTALFFLFYSKEKESFFELKKLMAIVIYGLIILFVGFPLAGTGLEIFKAFFKILGEIAKSTYAEAARDTAGSPIVRIFDIYRRTNPLFFYALQFGSFAVIGISIITVLIKKRISAHFKLFIPFSLMLFYLVLFLYAFVLGINPIAGGWFRAFWPSMTIFGGFIAVMWRVVFDNFEVVFGKWESKMGLFRWFGWVFGSLFGILTIVVGVGYLKTTYDSFRAETLKYVEISSAYPTNLSLNLKKGQWPDKLPKLTPAWMDPNDTGFRFYDMDATVNIWWNSVFKMPLARGYLDANPKERGAENYQGWQYWQNVTLMKDEAVKSWDVPEELAANQAKFLIDWNAIKFFEGNQSLQRPYGAKLSSYVENDKNLINKSETVEIIGPTVFWDNLGNRFFDNSKQELKYFEVDDVATSPIYSASNAPTILVVGDTAGQDIMMRNFAFLGLTSRNAIIVQWNKEADKLSQDDLKNFDLVIFFRYKYANSGKVFKNLEKYVKAGGNLFIDTGTEQAESNTTSLPAVFPFENSERKPLGKEWEITAEDSEITKGVDFSKFSEPVFDGAEWNFTYPVGGLRGNSKTLVYNHKKPVLVWQKLGEGVVIWNGMNFAGHLQGYRNLEETKLFKNILFSFSDLSKDNMVKVSYERPASEKVEIRGSKAKGILFKESGYAGWDAVVNAGGKSKKVKIFEAGPMVPGYMFVFVPEDMRGGDFKAVFKYHGEFVYKFTYLVSFLSFFIVLDILLFEKRILKFLKRKSAFFHKGVGNWWEKEDEF